MYKAWAGFYASSLTRLKGRLIRKPEGVRLPRNAFLPEEFLDEIAALALEHPTGHDKTVLQAGRVEPAHRGHEGAGLRLDRSVNHLTNPRMEERAHAHQTRLDGHVNRGVSQTIVAHLACRFPQREHFGVRRWIDGADWLVERGR